MQIRDLQPKRALRSVLIVLLLSAVGLTNVLAQTQGMLNGKFTVDSNGKQVHFSQGNLQYRASTHTWRFAYDQCESIGLGNNNISPTYNGWIDLFGFGTGDNPTNSSLNYNYNTFTDWGVNAISNGGNQENFGWYTLSKNEWSYMLFTRSTPSGKRYAKAKIGEITGVILLPDDWTTSTYSLNNTNTASANFNSNVLTTSQWSILENAGAVFLPITGYRDGTNVLSYLASGGYWSSSFSSSNPGYGLPRSSYWFCFGYYYNNGYPVHFLRVNEQLRYVGAAVRLVRDVSLSTSNIDVMSNPAEGGTVSGGGTYDLGATCTVTATANDGYTFAYWTENGSVVSTNTSYGFTVTGDRTLVANFNLNSYSISTSVNPTTGGTVYGGGIYIYGTTCNLIAIANDGYTFTNWTENGTEVCTNANYSFTVTSDRNLVANFTTTPQNYTISVSANPSNGGTVTGAGTFVEGVTCTITASANNGYSFTNWTENGTVVSTNASYSFIVTSNRTLVANFSLNNYNISVVANPSTGGTITGGGSYTHGTTCNLMATTNSGYTFINWTENGTVVSIEASYSFTVTDNRNLVANFSLNSYTISVFANPTASGTIIGGGTYDYGASCTLTATVNNGYTFINWTKGPNVVSTDAIYSFTVTESGEYVANFELNSYQITTTANPTEGGTATGGGTYAHGATCTLTAVANEDYAFSNWTENGMVVSTDTVYSFTVSSNRILVANFTNIGTGGMLDGMFSVSNSKKVCFSQGNLQYQASTDTWRFATNQYDHIGEGNANISQTYDGWIDLFGWGTSGYDHGAVCYQPWSTSQTNSDYYAYGIDTCNLFDQNGQADWGYNAISNGGNQPNYWRTLTYAEWYCVCNTRNTASGIRYAKAQVNNINGLILLPDDWSTTTYSLNSPNTPDASFSSNVISLSQWATLENAGAVFLPVTGTRGGSSVYWMDRAHYWSSRYNNSNNATALSFGVNNNDESYFGFYTDSRNSGHAVRLVKTVTYTINTTSSPTEGGMVIGAGTYDSGETCTLTAITNEGYAFVNWTENGNTVSINSTISFVVSCDRNVVANFLYVGTEEMMKGMFSVSNNKKVCFSQGNLQYQASTDTWRFAEHQWDYVGGTAMGVHYGNVGNSSNSNISSTYDGWIDLFGWGTSGWDNGNTCYHPWDINSDNDGALFGPPSLNSLVGEYANADWGVYNPISNGGNQANQWRSLTYWEWDYLFNARSTSSGVRYAKAQLNGVNGLILVPDNWDVSVYELQNVNTSESPFDSNVIGLTEWINTFEPNGAVFLPSAGARFYGTTMFYLNDRGYYWSSTCHGNLEDYASNWAFSDEWLNHFAGNRSYGLSVRLVRDVVTQTVNLSQGWNWWSTNLEITLDDLKAALMDAAPGTNITIKSRTQNISYNSGTHQWMGTLDAFDVTQMYMIYVSTDCEITLTGTLINPAEHPVSISNGSNWIAFPLAENMSVSDAFAGFAVNGDKVKSRNNNSQYQGGSWRGQLTTLVPGQGYMYISNSQEPRTFTFPANTTKSACLERKKDQESE